MNSSLKAPGVTEKIRATSALVLAPHYDDEVLGCGGLLSQLVASGAAVRVLFLSDGGGGEEEVGDRETYRRRRLEEARRAAEVLGLAGVDRLDLPDGALDQHLGEMADGIRRALLTLRPELVLVTSPLEVSRDHRAAFLALQNVVTHLAAEEKTSVETLRVLAYEVNQPLYPDLLVDVSAEVPRIERAMACYESQQEKHDYLAACLGRLRFRALTLPAEVTAAEAYRRLLPADLQTHSPARLIAELGGAPALLEIREGPRISVIVRTRNRPQLLAEALASLARSTYRRAEVLVVNDGGTPPDLPADHPLELRRIDLETNRGRAAAANAGVAAAVGEYIAFLDDDDLADPEHLATLAGLVSGAGVRVAYTDAAVGVYRLGAEGWQTVERRLPYSRDFDPDLLLFDNYIPLNTLLIERELLREVGEVDPALDFFEDWDLLIRLSDRTAFHHLAQVTCEYRQFRGAEHHILGDRPRERADFLAMKARVLEKHAARRTAASTARVVDLLRAEAVAGEERSASLLRELERSEERFHELNGRLAAGEIHRQTLAESQKRLAAEIDQERRDHRKTALEVERLYAREKNLDKEVRRLYDRERQLEETVGELCRDLEGAHADLERAYAHNGDTAEKLRLMTEQESRVAEELRKTYAEIERLNRLVRDMEDTRAWRAHQWWQKRKHGGAHS